VKSTAEDGELIRRVRAGERAAFAALAARLDGLGIDETGDLLELAVPDQRMLLHRARARVARALDAHARGERAAGVRSGPRRGSEAPGAARIIHGA
jgi:hypothetical protein